MAKSWLFLLSCISSFASAQFVPLAGNRTTSRKACSFAPSCSPIATTRTVFANATSYQTLPADTSSFTVYVTNRVNQTNSYNATSFITETDSTTTMHSDTEYSTRSTMVTQNYTTTITEQGKSSTTTITTTSTCTPTRGVAKRSDESACVVKTSVRTIWPTEVPRNGSATPFPVYNSTGPSNTTVPVTSSPVISDCFCATYTTTTSTVSGIATITPEVVNTTVTSTLVLTEIFNATSTKVITSPTETSTENDYATTTIIVPSTSTYTETSTETYTQYPPVTTETASAEAVSTYAGNFTAVFGDIYYLYPNSDFYGNDAYAGICDGTSTVCNNINCYQCASYQDCMNVCSSSNEDGSTFSGGTNWCVGVSFTPDGEGGREPNNCWLKFADPGHGVDGCGAYQSYPVDSAILQVLHDQT